MLCSASVSALQIMFNNNLYESIAKWETFQIFKEDIVGVLLPGGSVTKTGLLLDISRAAVSKVMMTYTNHGRTSLAKRNSGQKSKLRGLCTAAKVTAELNIHLKDCFHKNSLTRSAQIQHPW